MSLQKEITERKRAEADLAASQDQLRNLNKTLAQRVESTSPGTRPHMEAFPGPSRCEQLERNYPPRKPGMVCPRLASSLTISSARAENGSSTQTTGNVRWQNSPI